MPKYPTFPDLFDEVKDLSITVLKRLGYMKRDKWVSGNIFWKRGGQLIGSITVSVNMAHADKYVELDYKCNGKPINYRVRLESLPSNLGFGEVWYFICPATNRRCRKLYGIGEHFLSRFAYPSAMYSKQTESKQSRYLGIVFETMRLDDDFFNRRYARTHYKGEPTRRYMRYLKRKDRGFSSGAIYRFLRS